MFYKGMVIHCNNQTEWDELMDLLETEGYQWPMGWPPSGCQYPFGKETQYVLIDSDVQKRFFRRGIDNIHNPDVQHFDTPIEYTDLIGDRRKISVTINDLI